MQEIKEQETLPFEEDSQLPEEATKYHKRIDDLIEDAEIEAEMEAEKKIRSKNSRMFSISMIGITLLALIYFQVNHQTAVVPIETIKETLWGKPEMAEERLAKQVPLLEEESNGSLLPVPEAIDSTKTIKKPLLITKPKAKVITTSANVNELINIPLASKIFISTKKKSSPKKITPVTENKSTKFYIQAGAFGVKRNAKSLLKKLKGKGFSPSIQTREQKLSQHIVTVGRFANTKAGDKTLKQLTEKGFKASYYKNAENYFNLKVGQFSSLKDARKSQDNLRLKGFLPGSHKADVPVKTYIVQLGVFPSLEKARHIKEKLARAGFSKTFLR